MQMISTSPYYSYGQPAYYFYQNPQMQYFTNYQYYPSSQLFYPDGSHYYYSGVDGRRVVLAPKRFPRPAPRPAGPNMARLLGGPKKNFLSARNNGKRGGLNLKLGRGGGGGIFSKLGNLANAGLKMANGGGEQNGGLGGGLPFPGEDPGMLLDNIMGEPLGLNDIGDIIGGGGFDIGGFDIGGLDIGGFDIGGFGF